MLRISNIQEVLVLYTVFPLIFQYRYLVPNLEFIFTDCTQCLRKMNFIFVFILLTVCESVLSMPCLTSKSKQDFTKARNALKSLESFLKNQATAINQKVKQLDNDMVSMEEDFKSKSYRCFVNIFCSSSSVSVIF